DINLIDDSSSNINVDSSSNVAPEEPPTSIGHVDPGLIKPIEPSATPNPSKFRDSGPTTPPAEEDNDNDQKGKKEGDHGIPKIAGDQSLRNSEGQAPPIPSTSSSDSSAGPGIIAEYPADEAYRDNDATSPPSEDFLPMPGAKPVDDFRDGGNGKPPDNR